MGTLPSTHQNQRTLAPRIAGRKQGESATAIMMVQDDKWYDSIFQSAISIAKTLRAQLAMAEPHFLWKNVVAASAEGTQASEGNVEAKGDETRQDKTQNKRQSNSQTKMKREREGNQK